MEQEVNPRRAYQPTALIYNESLMFPKLIPRLLYDILLIIILNINHIGKCCNEISISVVSQYIIGQKLPDI